MSLSESDVFTAARSAALVVTSLSESQVFRARQQLPQPQQAYIAFRRLSNTGVGRSQEVSLGVWRQHRALSVQIDAVGDCVEELLSFNSILRSKSSLLEAIRSVGVGVARVGQVRDLTRSAPVGWESVVGFDMTFSYVKEILGNATPSAGRIITSVESVGDELHGPIAVSDELADPNAAAFLALAAASGLLAVPSGLLPL